MILRLEMKDDINRETAKTLVFLSGKIEKYEYPTGEEVLASNQNRCVKQVKFTYFPLGKNFWNFWTWSFKTCGISIKPVEYQQK